MYVTVCCSVLQCVAVCCSACCSVLQCVARLQELLLEAPCKGSYKRTSHVRAHFLKVQRHLKGVPQNARVLVQNQMQCKESYF